MLQKLRGIKILGLTLLAALSLMAATAAAAQAGEFRIEGKTFAESKITSESIKGTIALSQFTVPWLGLVIHCPSGGITGKIVQGGKVSAEATFEGCKVEENKFCKLYPTLSDLKAETNAGVIRTGSEGEVVLMGGKHYVQFGSEKFNTVFIGTATKGCTLPQEMVASGKVDLAAPSALISSVNQTLTSLSQAEDEALFGAKLFCSAQAAAVLGSESSVHLSGVNEGKKWGFE